MNTPYHIIRSKRRTIALEITPHAEIIIRAPIHFPQSTIDKLITHKTEWIKKHLSRLALLPAARKPTLTNKEPFPYLGKQYALIPMEGILTPHLHNNQLLVPPLRTSLLTVLLTHWYKTQAHIILHEQTKEWAKKMHTSYQAIHITSASTRWGSCGAKNNLNFTWRLVCTPLSVIEYVVIHELAHTIHKNHGKNFWKLVTEHCPNWHAQRHWLKIHGASLPDTFR